MRAPPPLPTETILDPYIGLRPYTDSEDDQVRFKGREQDQQIIIANLYAASLTVFYGASGVGKSSVLLAGVVPKLRRTPGFACVVFRTWQSENVLPSLKTAIVEAVQAAAQKEVEVDPALQLDEFLLQCTRALRGHIVLIFDQFEEYFLYHGASAISEGFDAEFARSVNRSQIDASFLLSMREDGLSKLDRFQGRIPKLLNNLLRLDHLDRKAATRAIREPLDECNKRLPPGEPCASIDDDLVEALLDQLKAGSVTLDRGRQAGATVVPATPGNNEMWIETPFLQVVLTRLWDEEKKHGSRQLRLATLNKLGGAPRILRTHLDRTMRKLKRRQRRISVDIFGYLVTPSGGKIAHTVADLASYSRRRTSRLSPLLERLADSNIRVLRTIPPPPGELGGARYEIFHDVLAPAILTWRRRKLIWRRVWRGMRWAFSILTVVILVLVVIGLAGIDQQRRTKAALDQTEEALGVVGRLDKAVPYFHAVMRGHAGGIGKVACSPDAKFLATASGDRTARVWEIDTGEAIVKLPGHTQGVSDVAFSPDGRLLASCAADNTARLWNGETGRLARELKGHEKPISMIAFNPKGNLLVTASQDHTARIWDVESGKEQAKLEHDDYVNSAVFSPNGDQIITASADGTARIWDVKTGARIAELRGHTGVLYNAMFSPDGSLALTASLDETARTWDAVTGAKIATLSGHEGVVVKAVFSPDSKLVATASVDGTARIWNARTGAVLAVLVGHTGGVWDVAFSPNGERVVTASDDNTARVWETSTGKLEAVLRGHTRDVTTAVFTPDGKFVVTGSEDGTARVWTTIAAHSFVTLKHGAEIYEAKWSSDSRLIVTASSDKTARVWKSDGTLVTTLRGHSREVVGADFSPDNAFVVTASLDNTAVVWNALTGQKVMSLVGHANWIKDVAFSPDGHFIVTASWDGTAKLWDWPSGIELHTVEHHGRLTSVAFSSDSRMLVTGAEDGSVKVWDTETGQALLDMPWHLAGVAIASDPVDNLCVLTASADATARIWCLVEGVKPILLGKHVHSLTNGRFSPDGTMVVTASRDCSARVWETSNGEQIAFLEHSDDVFDAAFSPDSKLVVTASGDGSARVWEARTGRRLAELREHAGAVNGAAFSPDGQFIVTASADHTARIWKVGAW